MHLSALKMLPWTLAWWPVRPSPDALAFVTSCTENSWRRALGCVLQAQVADLQADIRGLQREIADRDDIINDNFHAMRLQKDRVLLLEKTVFVLEMRKKVRPFALQSCCCCCCCCCCLLGTCAQCW